MSFRLRIFFSQILLNGLLFLVLFPFLKNQYSVLIILAPFVLNVLLILIMTQGVMRPVRQIIEAIRPFDFLTDQRQETEEILKSLEEGIIAVDPSAKVTFINNAACRMLNVFPEDIFGKALDMINGEIGKKCHELLVHTLQTSELNRHAWSEKNKRWDLISAPLTHRHGAVLLVQDKTSDYRIIELGKDFIANASHELRTPITIIRGFAETLQDLPEISGQMLQEITEKIVKTCIRLDKLVRSLLTLTDMEHLSKEHFSKVDLIAVIERSMQTLLAIHPDTKIRLDVAKITAHTVGDGDLLEMALMNVLENAVKYSKESAEIEISLEVIQDKIHIKVQDQGIGISEEDLPQIFERFYTVDKARSRKKGGAGLGLSIVRAIIEKHKGKVWVSSKLGKGSLFTFVLPQKESK